MDFNVSNVILDLAIILLTTKVLGLLARKIGLPQVVGMVVAGLLLGPAILGNLGIPGFHGFINPTEAELDVLDTFSQVGVILILFSSGLNTDVKELKSSGLAATFIACIGVAVPIAMGTIITVLFMGGFSNLSDPAKLHNALYVGSILAATSVGITVETLKELGKMKSRIGTTILSAAIIDDVIGIIALSLITSLKSGGGIWPTIGKALGFFIFTVGFGFGLRELLIAISNRHPHSQRLGIFSIALCFFFAFAAEEFFGIAAITGAYMAGLMLSGLRETGYVDRKVVVSSYMFFTPVFFAYIGISADFSHFKPSDLMFCLVFVFVGILAKIIGCGGAARLCKYSGRDSLSIGCGMVARGEVALAVYSTGAILIDYAPDGTLLGIDPLVATIMLILVSSIVCPILLKLSTKSKKASADPAAAIDSASCDADAGGNNSALDDYKDSNDTCADIN